MQNDKSFSHRSAHNYRTMYNWIIEAILNEAINRNQVVELGTNSLRFLQ